MKKVLALAALAAAGIVLWRKVAEDREVRQQWTAVRSPTWPQSAPNHNYTPGAMAQLVAHLLCKQGVTGSSPVGST